MNNTAEMDVWNAEVPVIILSSDPEFNTWVDEFTPYSDIGESPIPIVRRRASIF
jgi:hypothetical protein